MQFELSDIHLEDQQKAREFAEKEVVPMADKYDKLQKFPMDTVMKMGKEGFLGIPFPKKYGGMERDYISYAIIVEEISRKCGSMGITVAAHNSLCSNHIYQAGSEEQKEKYLTRLASGQCLGAWGLTEPNAGSDPANMATTAVKNGDEWVLNGTKLFITHGKEAEIFVVLASTDKSLGSRGVTGFVIEKGTEGFGPGGKENKLGLRASDTSELILENCHLPDSNRLGDINKGFYDTMKTLDGGRVSIGALGLGIAQGILDEFQRYVKDRAEKEPRYAKQQHVQWALADMATRTEAARLLIYQAGYRKSAGLPVSKESSMGKMYSSEVATANGVLAMKIMGKYGYDRRYGVERLARDAKLCEIGEGTSEIQRLVISRQLGLK